MSEVGAAAIHHRASPSDHGHAVLPTVLHGRLGNAALGPRERRVHPDAWNTGGGTIVHDTFGGVGTGDDHHAVHATRNGLHVRIATLALERLHRGVDREHFVARVLQSVIDQVSDRMAAVV